MSFERFQVFHEIFGSIIHLDWQNLELWWEHRRHDFCTICQVSAGEQLIDRQECADFSGHTNHPILKIKDNNHKIFDNKNEKCKKMSCNSSRSSEPYYKQ